jgi:cytochrome c-type biogenesis protein
MLDAIFTWLSTAIQESFGIALIAAFGWGIASILLSPCHLSSIPLAIGYVSSQGNEGMRRSYFLAFFFALGILISIAIIGIVTAAIGRMLGDIGGWSNILVAGVFLVVGLYLLDFINVSWGRFIPRSVTFSGWKGALFLGLIFGIGLGPCTFAFLAPVLGIVFRLAPTEPAGAISLLAAFAAGHCLLITGAGGSVGSVQKYVHWSDQSRKLQQLRRISGVLVLLGGLYYVLSSF